MVLLFDKIESIRKGTFGCNNKSTDKRTGDKIKKAIECFARLFYL
jgi:hypothetical protein